MPVLPFPDYRPDNSDLNAGHTQSILNVVPTGSGYGPFPDISVFTSALPSRCRGAFFARKSDGSVAIFAGTATKLYLLDNTTLTWTDVSKSGGTYSQLSSDANWVFAQFNDAVVAVQENVVPQAFTLSSSSQFDDLAGSPPQAAHVTVVNRFLVLSGLLTFPKRVHWSGLNDITTWTSGSKYSDSQDMPDGDNVRCVVGGEYGVILQDNAIRRMVFTPGSDIVFDVERISKDTGTIYPYSVVEAGGVIYFYSTKGFMKFNPEGSLTPIGKERVDRTFGTAHDPSRPDLFMGAADPTSHLILWAYRTKDSSASLFNHLLAYDYVLDKWSPIEHEGEFINSLARPGITLEALNTIGSVDVSNTSAANTGEIILSVESTEGWANGDIKEIADVGGTTEANGEWPILLLSNTEILLEGSEWANNAYTSGGYVAGSLDDLGISLDDIESATLPQFAAFDAHHCLAFFTGDVKEATLETGEQSGISKRLFIRGVYPLTDADEAYASIAKRENLKTAASYSSETSINTQGFCPQRVSTRHARVKLRIPAGTSWTYAKGVEPDYKAGGKR